MSRCESRCFFYLTTVCFCRTYGNTCSILPGPGLGLEQDAAHGSGFSLQPALVERVRKESGDIVASFLDWTIPKELTVEGKTHIIRGRFSEGKESWAFEGEILFHFGIANIYYEIEGHPEIRSIGADVGPLGAGGGVRIERESGEQYVSFNRAE
ncbi:MAG: hypothetical protein AAF725_04075 [Acidobacteriota bacterium]